MKYFAYGSNMSVARLQERVPGAIPKGLFTLKGHSLKFHKVSNDGSGKCDCQFTGNCKDDVFGALFEIQEEDEAKLDRFEGYVHGYDKKTVTVSNCKDESFKAIMYFATKTDPSLQPYSWYMHHVIYGATEIGVPDDYLEFLRSVKCIDDPNTKREKRELAIYGSDTVDPIENL
ncbi:MAG: hypothetical protein BCS36_02175 [Desulfovibrio sp. MES5]|uniref:gamma-glutamylcyclotransferase family protein n=1 Tax=Desulfovibrio sp. MES5 TaxID=1899016 RepID=UPI000B9CF7BC|nr:gamma-glutamylcyclotransferase family protein [Desulfovibrio sp. MES5]OXS28665.1 MAG: hypothetical protein BCS36_02175 [Desulfovibrio sp. MES5]